MPRDTLARVTIQRLGSHPVLLLGSLAPLLPLLAACGRPTASAATDAPTTTPISPSPSTTPDTPSTPTPTATNPKQGHACGGLGCRSFDDIRDAFAIVLESETGGPRHR